MTSASQRSKMDEPSAEDRAGYRERLEQLEIEASPLEPGAEERALLRGKVIAFADDFLENVDGRPTFVKSEGEDSALYDSPISEESTDPDEALDLLDRGVIRSGVNVGSAGHLAYIPGSTLYASTLADYLAAVTNRYSGLYFASPGAVRMERVLLRWMEGFRQGGRLPEFAEPARDRQGAAYRRAQGVGQAVRSPRRTASHATRGP